MPLENDRYSGTTADLNLRKKDENQPTDEMIEMITKAGKWARIISYTALFTLLLCVLSALPAFIFLFRQVFFVIPTIIIYGIFIYIIWIIYNTTKKYAVIARDLDDSNTQSEDIATCFELHTRFIKIISMLFIVIFVTAILAAIALPAYQQYLIRARG